MAIKFFCDGCGNEKLPHELTTIKIVTDRQLCESCKVKIEAILNDLWGDKK